MAEDKTRVADRRSACIYLRDSHSPGETDAELGLPFQVMG
jgi:hypothetical protein